MMILWDTECPWFVRLCIVLISILNLPGVWIVVPWVQILVGQSDHGSIVGLFAPLPIMASWLLGVPLILLSKAGRRSGLLWLALGLGIWSLAAYDKVFNCGALSGRS